MNDMEGQSGLSSLGIPSGVDKGPSRSDDDMLVTLQLKALNDQMEQAKIIARTAGPAKAHPYLNAVLGIVANAVDPEITGAAFDKATAAHMGPALAEHEQLQKAALSIIEEGQRRQKAFQNILASNPEALIPMVPEGDVEAQKQLGLAAFGIPVPIDPRLKSQVKLEEIYRKNRIKFHLDTARMAMAAGNSQLAESEMNMIKDIVDPDGNSQIDPGDLVDRRRAATVNPATFASNYEESKQAMDAMIAFQLTGDHEAFLTTLGGLHPRGKTDRAQTRLEKIADLSTSLTSHMIETGEEDQAKALKTMPEDFQIQWDAIMPKGMKSDELTQDDISREQRAAYDDALNYYRVIGYQPEQSEVNALAKSFLRQRLKEQEKIKDQSARSQRKIIKDAQTSPVNAPSVQPMTEAVWKKEVLARAKKSGRDYATESAAYAAELNDQKKADRIPPSVRRKVGF